MIECTAAAWVGREGLGEGRGRLLPTERWRGRERNSHILRATTRHLTLNPKQPYPEGVDSTRRELYLSDADFKITFNCTKEDFQNMPAWKRELLKRKKGLF